MGTSPCHQQTLFHVLHTYRSIYYKHWSFTEKFKQAKDKCAFAINACPSSFLYTCKKSEKGTCIHKCDKENGFCGEHGQCSFDVASNVIVCRYPLSFLDSSVFLSIVSFDDRILECLLSQIPYVLLFIFSICIQY